MKFKNYIEVQSGIKDSADSPGTLSQVLTSTATGVAWIDQAEIISGTAEKVSILVKNTEGVALVKGDPVYIIGSVGASARLEVGLCDASDPDKMPCVGLLEQDLLDNGEGNAVTSGKLRNLVTTPIDGQATSENDTIYVKAGGSSGSSLTTTKPTGSTNLIQNVGQVGRVSSSSDGNFVVSAIMRTNDVPNLPEGRIWVGDGNTIVSDTVYVDEPNNRVGIGTADPYAELYVKSPVAQSITNDIETTTAGFVINGSDENMSLQFGLGGAALNYGNWIQSGYDNGTPGSSPLFLNPIGGNVGIGTDNPQQKLDVVGRIRASYDTSNYYEIGASSAGGFVVGKSSGVETVNIRTYGNSHFTGGNVGIGTTSPDNKFMVQGASTDGAPSAGNVALFEGPSGTNGLKLFVDDTANASGFQTISADDLLINPHGGNVGIGTNSPQAKLDVDGDTFLASRHIKISGTGINTYFTAATHDSSGTEGLLNKLSIKSVGTFFDHGALAITNTTVAEPLDTTIVQETISSGDTDWNVLTLPKESGTFALENWVTSNFAPSTGGSYLPLSAGSGSPLTGDLYMPGFMYHVGDTDSYFGFGAPNVFDLATGGSRKLYADSAALYLYYSGSQKLRTTNTGVTVTGDIQIDSALLSNQENTDIDSAAAEVVAQVAISYTAAFFDFVVKKGTNIRSGTVYACHDGTNVEFTETSTNDLGDTSDVTLSVDKTSTNLRLIATVTSDDWSVKSLIRAI